MEDLKSSSRKSKVVHARSIVTYAAVKGSGYKGCEVAEVLSLSRPTISACVEKGKIFLLCRLPRSSGRWYWGEMRSTSNWYDNNEALRLELLIT